MWCRYCGKPCGEREFCDEFCYEGYQCDMEEYRNQMAKEAMLADDEGPQNEWCGSRGNNI